MFFRNLENDDLNQLGRYMRLGKELLYHSSNLATQIRLDSIPNVVVG